MRWFKLNFLIIKMIKIMKLFQKLLLYFKKIKKKSSLIIFFLSIINIPIIAEYKLSADSIEYSGSSFTAKKNIHITIDENKILADELQGSLNSNIINLNGNIILDSKPYLLYADTLLYDHFVKTGIFENVSLKSNQLSINCNQAIQTINNELNLTDAIITTCTNKTPHYSICVNSAEIDNSNKLKLNNVWLRIYDLPIIYLPYLKYSLRDSNNFELKTKYSNNLGYSISPSVRFLINNNLSANSKLQYYSERGIGFEQRFKLNSKKNNFDLSMFYLNDKSPYNRYNSVDEKKLINNDRYYLDFSSDNLWTDTKYLKSKISYLSDKYLKEEFYRDEYLLEPQPENFLSGVTVNDTYGAELYVNNRLNDFYSNLNRAQISASLFRTKISKTPVYFNSRNSISYLDLLDSNSNIEDTFRLYTRNEFHLPSKIGYFNFNPKLMLGYSYYSKTMNDQSFDNLHLGVGFESSVQLSKVIHDKNMWFGKGLKHSVKPYINYNYFNNSSSTNSIYQYDNLDAYYDHDFIKIGLNQLFLTKKDHKLSRLCEFDLYTIGSKKNNSDNFFEDLLVDGRVLITDSLNFDYIANYNTSNGNIPLSISRLNLLKPLFNFSFSQYEINDSSLISTRFQITPNSSFSIDSYIRYEYENNDFEHAGLTAYFNNCCTRYGIGYKLSRGNSHSILLSVNLLEFED